MALTGEQTFKGLTISNAYVRVMSVHYRVVDTQDDAGNWSETLYADYTVKVYKDADARTAGNDAITTVSGSFAPSVANAANLNIVKQTYTHLKTLSDFSNLADISKSGVRDRT